MPIQAPEMAQADRFFFENNGYLVVEEFLPPGLVARLLAVSLRVAEERREKQRAGATQAGMTHVDGDNTRYFYILGDDPLFLEMLTYPPLMPYVTGLLNAKPHHHASDIIIERAPHDRGMGWHIDGHDDGYRLLGAPIPLLQLKVGYYLTDMTAPDQGNLCVIPGSHKAVVQPDADDLQKTELFDGATQVCAPAGTVILFHNALWHSAGPLTREDGRRVIAYYAYEHPWMIASAEHWGYPPEFYAALNEEQRSMFHGFVFDPPEQRWG
jgi:hypothetical protein